MDAIDRAIRQARSRLFYQSWLVGLGWCVLAALALSLGFVLSDRLLALAVADWAYLALAVLVVVVPPVVAWSRRWEERRVAELLDDRLKLKDRLATGLFVRQGTQGEAGFYPQVLADARAAAVKAPVHQATPLRLTRVWQYVPPLAGVLALAWMFVGQADWLGLREAREQQQAQADKAAADKAKIVQVIAATEKAMTPRRENSELKPIDGLGELAELTHRDLADPRMQKKLAAKLSDVEQRLADTARQLQEDDQALRNALSRLPSQGDGATKAITDALRRGDYQAAADALSKLEKQLDGMSPEQREQAAGELDKLSQQLQAQGQQLTAQARQTQQQIQQTLQNAGLSQQQIQQLQQQGMNPQQVQQALQQQGQSPQQAQRTAQQIQNMQQQQQRQSQTGLACNKLGQCAGQAGQSMQGSAQSLSQKFNGQQLQDQLQQLGQGQQQMQQIAQARQQVQSAMSGMGQGMGNQSQPGRNQQAGVGGKTWGTGSGGNPIGTSSGYGGYQTQQQGDISQGQGRVIASWQADGELARGEAKLEYETQITAARDAAEDAITDDRVPRKLHSAVKHYFDQLPESPDQVTAKPSAPKAPR